MNFNQAVSRILFAATFVASFMLAPYAGAAPRFLPAGADRKAAIVANGFTTHARQTVTNGILTVLYDDTTGLFSIETGASHPKPNETVFFPIGTSYITLRDATNKIMYNNDEFGPSTPGLAGYTLASMTNTPPVVTTLPKGFRAVYTVPDYEVTQDVVINGTTLADTNVLHQVSVRNTSTAARDFGLRYMYDWQIAGNDASLFRPRSPDGTFSSTFTTFDSPDFKLYEEVDDATAPTFSIYGSVRDLDLTPPPTLPDQLRYSRWSASSNSAWDFVNTGAGSDSSVVYYWGFNAPINLAAGTTKTFAQYVTTQLSAIAPTVRFSAPTYTVNENGGSATITLTREGNTTGTSTVQFATSNGTATAPADYTAVTQTINFAAGETTKTITIPIISDGIGEPNETVNLTLSGAVDSVLEGTATAVLTIVDATVVRFSAPTYTVNENGVSATITVVRDGDANSAASVDFATSNGTATAPADYTAVTQTINFAAGESTKTVSIPIVNDGVSEPNETVNLTLSNAVGVALSPTPSAVLTIIDNTPITISINDVTVTEGNTGTVNATFTVTLSAAPTQTVTVGYATANGTATAPADYTAANGLVSFGRGETSKTIVVRVNGDTVAEGNENFLVNLSAPNNATIADAQGQGTIIDDEGPPRLSINNVTVTEGDSGTTNATFTVTLAPASGQTVTVNAIPFNGSARAPFDYTGGGAMLSFAPGQTSKTFSVPVVGDTLNEADEVFYVILSAPVNAAIASGNGRGIGTIKDNDAVPAITIEDVRIGEGNSGLRTAVFRLHLSAPSGQLVKVFYSTSNGTSTSGEDYVAVTDKEIAFTTGQDIALARVLINGDLLNEKDETFFVNLSNASGASITQKQSTGVILNDDRAPSITVSDARIVEGNVGQSNLSFNVNLSAPSGQIVTVNYITANGTASASSDYRAASGTLSFAPGETSKTIDVPVIGDRTSEPDEVLYALLTGSANATIGRGRAIGTIINDDASR